MCCLVDFIKGCCPVNCRFTSLSNLEGCKGKELLTYMSLAYVTSLIRFHIPLLYEEVTNLSESVLNSLSM